MKKAIFISAFLLVLAVCAIFIIPLNIPAASAENTGSASTIKSSDVPTVTETAEIDSNSDCCSYLAPPVAGSFRPWASMWLAITIPRFVPRKKLRIKWNPSWQQRRRL